MIEVLIGISGSGKSYYAHSKWERNPVTTVIINRDKLRESLFGYTEETISEYYQNPKVHSLEKMITEHENILIKDALASNYNIIVDATHLKRKYIERYAYYNTDVQLTFFDITIEEAVFRDSNRIRTVGSEIIKRQYALYQNLKLELERTPITFKTEFIQPKDDGLPIYIFDLDGTLAMNVSGRSPFAWDRVEEDEVNYKLASLMQNLIDEAMIIICTGRSKESEIYTLRWLYANQIHFDDIYFRKAWDYRADWIVKEEMWREIMDKYNRPISILFDDRNQVVDRARYLGLDIYQVNYHNF